MATAKAINEFYNVCNRTGKIKNAGTLMTIVQMCTYLFRT
jgi:hypothetical protein